MAANKNAVDTSILSETMGSPKQIGAVDTSFMAASKNAVDTSILNETNAAPKVNLLDIHRQFQTSDQRSWYADVVDWRRLDAKLNSIIENGTDIPNSMDQAFN